MKNRRNAKSPGRQRGSVPFFEDPAIKEMISNPEMKSGIDEKYEILRVAEELEKVRRESGLTQAELSKRTHITQEELSRIERGKRNITLATYFKVLNGLGYRAEIKYHRIKG